MSRSLINYLRRACVSDAQRPERTALDLGRLEDRVLFSATPLGDAGGSDLSEVNALDAGPGDGVYSMLAFAIPVDALPNDGFDVNHAPVAHVDRAVAMMQEDRPFRWILPAALFTDPDPGDTLQWSLHHAGGGELPNWLTFDAEHRTIDGTPQNDDVGIVPLELSATDSHGAVAKIPFFMSISNVDDLPTIELPNTLIGTADETLHLGAHADTPLIIQDVDGLLPGDHYRLELSLEHGQLELREFVDLPLYIEFISSSSLTLQTDSMEAIQSVLERLEIHPAADFTGTTALKLTVSGVDASTDNPSGVARWSVADELPIQFAAAVDRPLSDLGLTSQNGLLFLENRLSDASYDELRSLHDRAWQRSPQQIASDLQLADGHALHAALSDAQSLTRGRGGVELPGSLAMAALGRELELTASATLGDLPGDAAWVLEGMAFRPVEGWRHAWMPSAILPSDFNDWKLSSDLQLTEISAWFRLAATWQARLGLASVPANVGGLALQYLHDMDSSRLEWVSNVVLSPWTLPVAIAAASGVSAGYCAWTTKNGSLFVGALAVIPAWNCIDPLPVLEQAARKRRDDSQESLESILSNEQTRPAATPVVSLDMESANNPGIESIVELGGGSRVSRPLASGELSADDEG